MHQYVIQEPLCSWQWRHMVFIEIENNIKLEKNF